MRDPLFYQAVRMLREFDRMFYNPHFGIHRTMTIEQAQELERQRNARDKWNYYVKKYAQYRKGKPITADEVLDCIENYLQEGTTKIQKE